VYFVHSFAAMGCDPVVTATVEYGADITACVGEKNVMGCQFHPEKSGTVGLNILRAFCELETGSC
jgi:glutamine amidotransferase